MKQVLIESRQAVGDQGVEFELVEGGGIEEGGGIDDGGGVWLNTELFAIRHSACSAGTSWVSGTWLLWERVAINACHWLST